ELRLQLIPITTAADATARMAIVADSTVIAFATHRHARSRPALAAGARGNATGIAGRTTTDIGQLHSWSVRIPVRPPLSASRINSMVGRYCVEGHTDKLFAQPSRIFAAIGGGFVNRRNDPSDVDSDFFSTLLLSRARKQLRSFSGEPIGGKSHPFARGRV